MANYIIKKSRPGLGHGLFAQKRFCRGEFLVEYKGVRIPTPYADTLESRYLFALDEQWTIDGSSAENTARYINHSCEPNCEGRFENGRVLIFAARDIKKGEEFTIDYGPEYFDEFIRTAGCKCASCMETVTR